MNILFVIISTCSNFSALPALWYGRSIRGTLWYYAWSTFIADMFGSYITKCFPLNYYVFGHLYHIAELVLISVFFSNILFKGWLRSVSLSITVAILIWYVYSAAPVFFTQRDWQDMALAMGFFILLCLVSLYKVLKDVEHVRLEQSPLFVFTAPMLLYASYTLLLMLFAEHFRSAPIQLRMQLWSVHNVLNIAKNLAIARVFYLQRTKIAA